jgi:hypothetical protein
MLGRLRAATGRWRHGRNCKKIVPALRRMGPPVAAALAHKSMDPRRAAPPDSILLDIVRYEPSDLRSVTVPARQPCYGAFSLDSGRPGAAATLYDL